MDQILKKKWVEEMYLFLSVPHDDDSAGVAVRTLPVRRVVLDNRAVVARVLLLRQLGDLRDLR